MVTPKNNIACDGTMTRINERARRTFDLNWFISPILRVLRILVFATVVAGIALLFTSRMAVAKMSEALLEVGSQMLNMKSTKLAGPTGIVLNGAHLQFQSGSSKLSQEQVLDHFQAECKKRSVKLEDLKAKLEDPRVGKELSAQLAEEDIDASLLDGVARIDRAGRGAVACLDAGDRPLDFESFVAAAKRFSETGELTELGGLRYIYVEATDEGSSFLTMWNQGAVNIKAMFPSQGDVPGWDLPGFPRPEGSRRILSAAEDTAKNAITLYSMPGQTEKGLSKFLKERLPESVWKPVQLEGKAREQLDASHSMMVSNGAESTLLSWSTDRLGNAVLSVLQL